MSSWTDNPQILGNFNPYVSQMPVVEYMGMVGRQKQQQYEQGVQKIEGEVDKIAGLDVVRDVDKQYLQSKLDGLQGDLSKVAAGDFSNFQLVNSVGGMISSIGKDSNIQNAVGSTIRYRGEVGKLHKDISDGKSNPANVYNFNKQANSWISGQKPGETFNGNYNPYFDIDKFTKEAFDAIKPDGFTYEQIYVTDENGNKLTQKTKDPITGAVREEPILSPIMTRLKKEGKFPEKVRQTLEHIFSDPRVGQQLSINGEFNYRGYSPDMLKQQLAISKNNQLSMYNERLKDLQLKKSSGQNVQVDIDDVTNNKTRINNQFDDLIRASYTNPDYVRGLIYKDNTRDNYMSMYTDIKEENTTHENPGWNQNFKLNQEANRVRQHQNEMAFKLKALNQDEKQHQDKLRFDLAKEAMKQGITEIPTQGPKLSDADVVFNFDENYKNAANQFTSKQDDLIFSTTFPENFLIGELSNLMKNGNLSREQAISTIIQKEANKDPDSNGDVNKYRTKWYQKALSSLNSPDSTPTPEIRDKKKSAEEAQSVFDKHSFLNETLKTNVPDESVKLLSTLEPANFTIFKLFGKNKEITLSPQDQYDIAIARSGSPLSGDEVYNASKAAQKRLELRGWSKSDVDDVIEQVFSGAMSKTKTGEYDVTPARKKFSELLKNVTNEENTEYLKNRAEQIKQFYMFNPTLEKSVITGDTETDIATTGKIKNYLAGYVAEGKNESSNLVSNVEKINNVLNNYKEGSIKTVADKNEITGETSVKLVFGNEKGETVGEMTIAADQAYNLGIDVSNWFTSPDVKIAEEVIRATGTENTSTVSSEKLADPYIYRQNNAYYNKSNFPLLQKLPPSYDVKANISVSNGKYYPYLYINDGGTDFVKPFEYPDASMENALQRLQSIDPQIIQKLIAENRARQ